MSNITEILNQQEAASLLWRLVTWACALYLLALGALVFIRPETVTRFLEGHASSAGHNLLEAGLRAIAGFGFMGASPEMKFATSFFWFGVVLLASAIPMMFLYRAHKRYASWAIPFAKRILPLFGGLALFLGAVIAGAMV